MRSNDLYNPNNVRPLSALNSGHDWLTLITCHGFNEAKGVYEFHRVVRAILVSID